MGTIKILDRDVVGCIAAGEVVERPATIVKELVENALDAGATRIEVQIGGGGIEQITVSDDGHGMDEVDAALALERHATSKISSLADLEKIRTYGFRGEALASIAAVCRLELVTRQSKALEGTRILVEGGETKQAGPFGSPEGTRVIVRDLFFNVPGRRKFLKSPQTEEAACFDLLGKVALARPDVAFQAKKEGRILYTLPRGESPRDRYLKLFPQTEENQLFSFERARDSLRLSGILGGPWIAKSARNSIFLYVNRRVVRPGVLGQAVIEGYSGYLQPGKFPVAVLFLEVDGKSVDVNVHPTKAEVRFSHPRDIFAFVEKSVAAQLRELQENVRPRVTAVNASEWKSASGRPYGHPVPGPAVQDLALFERLAPYAVETKASPVLLCSIAKTYALFREGDTLFLVDLHVAHERINYDLLVSRLQDGACPAQALLSPVLLQLSAPQHSMMSKYADFLMKTGLELEEFGADSVLIRSVPAGLQKIGERKFLLSFLDKLEKLDEVKGPEDADRKILATLACRSSVQAGDEVFAPEMQSLFENVLKSSNPYFCPHGRPILVKLTLDEVHRLFRRTWS